jgi:transcriptional regulator with XRE-family HTH domain
VDFAERVRRVRQALHITQEGLAARAGVSRGYISEIERGERPEATLRRPQKEALARALSQSDAAAFLALDVEAFEAAHPPNHREPASRRYEQMQELIAELLERVTALESQLRPPGPGDTKHNSPTLYQVHQGAAAASVSG